MIREQNRCETFKRDYSLVLLDIDEFKNINDKYGHLVGDEVLKLVATTIRKIVRKTDVVARWGGDEFVILLAETDLTTAKNIGESIREAVKNGDYNLESEITLSIGVSSTHANRKNVSLFESADEAMYQAKKTRRNETIYDL